MRNARHAWLSVLVVGLQVLQVAAQQNVPPAPPPASAPAAPAPDPTAVAATVNGLPILEIAVYRGLKGVPADQQAMARTEVINFLVENTLLEQHLKQQGIAVDNKEVEAKLKEVNDEIQKQGSTFEKVIKEMLLTEAEIRYQITAQLRWDKYVDGQADDKALRDLFDNNRELFDGTLVRARHILLTPAAGDARASEQAKLKLAEYKKQVELAGAVKPAANADPLAIERARTKAIDDAFSAIAAKESMCPSKSQDGDTGFFPRAGSMVEPFAGTAFSLKPYQVSDVITTQFGHHIILVTDRRPGRQVKFEEIKVEVKEVFGERLRDSLMARLRPAAKIVTK